jgi:hypothetical protein
MEKNKGALKRGDKLPQSSDTTTATLKELGISKDQSSRWQQLADVPEKDFEAALTAVPPKPGLTASDRRRSRPKKLRSDEN